MAADLGRDVDPKQRRPKADSNADGHRSDQERTGEGTAHSVDASGQRGSATHARWRSGEGGSGPEEDRFAQASIRQCRQRSPKVWGRPTRLSDCGSERGAVRTLDPPSVRCYRRSIGMSEHRWFIIGLVAVSAVFAGCGVATSTAPRPTTTAVTEADREKTVLLMVGDYLEVHLHGSTANRWSSLRTSSDSVLALALQQTELIALGAGDAGGVFRVMAVGSATLTAMQNPVCESEHPSCALPSRAFVLHVVVSAYS